MRTRQTHAVVLGVAGVALSAVALLGIRPALAQDAGASTAPVVVNDEAPPPVVNAALVGADAGSLLTTTTVTDAAPPAAVEANSASNSEDALLDGAAAWHAHRVARNAFPVGWTHAVEVVDALGIELGVRAVVGTLLDDPFGLSQASDDVSFGPGWGGRAHVGMSFGWLSARLEGGFSRHEMHGGATSPFIDVSAIEIPVSFVLRVALPSPILGVFLDVGGGATFWSVPVRVSQDRGLERLDGAWTPRIQGGLGVRILSYLEVMAEVALHLPDDLGGLGPVFSDMALYAGGGIGFVYGAYAP